MPPASVTIEKFVSITNPPNADHGDLLDHQVALTFDDGPAPAVTPSILATLAKFRMKAVFFQVGQMAQAYPNLTQDILGQGHSVGNHTWDHSDLATLSLNAAATNITNGYNAIKAAAGPSFSSILFRFPYFSSTPALETKINQMGLVPFYANIDPTDYDIPDPVQLLATALNAVEAEKKGIILLHDIQPQTAQMLDAFLTEIVLRGYTTVVFK